LFLLIWLILVISKSLWTMNINQCITYSFILLNKINISESYYLITLNIIIFIFLFVWTLIYFTSYISYSRFLQSKWTLFISYYFYIISFIILFFNWKLTISQSFTIFLVLIYFLNFIHHLYFTYIILSIPIKRKIIVSILW
jgi:hypothetical protein